MRKIILLLLISFLLYSFDLYAQNNFPPAYEITTDTFYKKELDKQYWQILEDPKNELTIEQVSLSPYADRFHFDTTKDSKFNLSVKTYWFRYRLRNVIGRDAKICLLTNSEQSDYYIYGPGGKYDHEVSGRFVSWKQRDGLKLWRAIPIALKPGDELIIYNSVHNSYHFLFSPVELSVSISGTDEFITRNYIKDESSRFESIHNSLFFGVMLFASLLNFLFFLVVRERVYLYFSLYVFFLGLGRFNDNLNIYHVFLRETPRLHGYLAYVIWNIAPVFLTLFTRSLFQTRKNLPRWDKLLVGISIIYVIITLSPLLLTFFAPLLKFKLVLNIIGTFSVLAIYYCILTTFFLSKSISNQVNRLISIAILPALFIWVVIFTPHSLYMNLGYVILPKKVLVWLYESWSFIETICLFWMVSFFAWLLLHRFVQLRKQVVQHELEKEKERSNLIAQQKIELEKQVAERTAELKSSLENLKSTQAQLIQSEKMASLGELTAGIAHEIQNPLNFVNNFSEVNKELIQELKQKIGTGNLTEAAGVATDIEKNEEKIIEHGKRADGIVKSMLQHSRRGKSEKEKTDINILTDEYLRLSYHNMRSKNTLFHATINTEFDPAIGKINIIPQDVGRALLNLFNNAFYYVAEKHNSNKNEYEPSVSVITRKLDAKVHIIIKDNGNGIPARYGDKIFQPFFTTKPTGTGTGLGLSLSYDIITKEHGGEITVESKEGEGAEFVVQLPL